MIKCYYCGEVIRNRSWHWIRFDSYAGKYVDVCNYCASCHIDEHHSWGLLTHID